MVKISSSRDFAFSLFCRTAAYCSSCTVSLSLACDMDSLVTRKNADPAVQKNRSAAEKKLDAARRTLKRSRSLYDSLYQNYVEQLITESEYSS